MTEAKAESVDKKPNKFNTFSGVFVPSVLAIFGAVVYYILPKVLGGVGLVKMLIIILLAHSITIATAFSISSIASNMNVKGGGLYYLISRSLGLEFGGTMGILLFFAQTVSISFYTLAFTKVISSILAIFSISFPELYIALISFTVFWLIAFKGAGFVIKLQYFILVAILVSFVSIFMGPGNAAAGTDFLGTQGILIPFWVGFVMFFPAVCGMDAGVGMSGDLKNPKKSLLIGSFTSIIFTLIIYLALTVKFFISATPMALSTDPHVAEGIAIVSLLVLLGVFMSTSSSALSYLMTSPRTMRALVSDNIFSRKFKFLSKSVGNSNEPRVAMFLTLIVGLSVIIAGDLYFVSQIVGIFFLTVYGWVNGAALLEAFSNNPSFRPEFKTPSIIPFYGLIACNITMFLFNPKIAIIAFVIQLFIFLLLLKKKTSRRLESVWLGVLFQMFRAILKRIEMTENSKKNWRPTILAFSTNEGNKISTATFLDWIGSKRTITKFFILISKFLKHRDKNIETIDLELKDYITKQDVHLIPKVILCKDYTHTFNTLIQAESIGNLPYNTVLFDFDEQLNIPEAINSSKALNKNILILRTKPGIQTYQNVDVWWSSTKNGNMMILLAFLITQAKIWRDNNAVINLYSVVQSRKEYNSVKDTLIRILDNARVDNINFEIILNKNNRKLKRIIQEKSRNSDLVIMGIPKTGRSGKATKGIPKQINSYTDKLKTSLVVFSNEEIDLKVY